MTPSVDDPWTDDVNIRDYTDTDLEQSRTRPMTFSDPTGQRRRYLVTILQETAFEGLSPIADRSARIELAWAIDNYEVPFARESYDVAYLIPPVGWVERMDTYDVETLPAQKPESRTVNVTTTPIVNDMATQAVEDGPYNSKADLVVQGAKRQLGLL